MTENKKKLRQQRNLRQVFELSPIGSGHITDEVFHGLSQTSLVSENLYSFYESLLTITSYYQHSQAGRGSLVAKLLEELGTSEKMEFEFALMKLPLWLGQNTKLVVMIKVKKTSGSLKSYSL